ncbi:MAG: hypothetical protein RL112_1061 [Planctomycetota bacterium]|jgi:creatinine amidohydrolase
MQDRHPHDLAKMTWPEAQALFDAKAIAILPVGSTEPHGPHLPLDTDVTIAHAQARRTAEKLHALGAPCFVLPPLAYGLVEYTAGFAGRVSLNPGTLWTLVDDILKSLAIQDLERAIVVNAHLEPAHVQILRGVMLDHHAPGEKRMHALFVDVTRRKLAERLGAEFQSGDCHAGSYETSLVLFADPDSVRESERRALPEVRIHLLERMKEGVTSFAKAGADRAYCGAPAQASADEGRALVETLADAAVEAARAAWPQAFAKG